MLSHRLYYALKPHVPWQLRMEVRRILARRQRRRSEAIWPINEAAARPPAEWPGWPEGKRFAFVLTHDVEGPEGLAKCRQLAEMEMALGFRSCFNFIPEGPYAVPSGLRAWLIENGFEVGVHDLKHDGKLFLSRRDFARKAARINHYLREWGAAGFRSGFMLRNLDWLQQLNVQYDSSTFDTDPFEFQPDGAGTIFPFWIPAPGTRWREPAASAAERGGYIELPYTLPQDSTLFLVLEEKTPAIWIRKVDWIAGCGGMSLSNVHPDYLDFDGHGARRQYPVRLYETFLRHVAQTYAGQYWHALPRDLAGWYNGIRPASRPAPAIPEAAGTELALPAPAASLAGRRAAVVLYSYYPSDPRPCRAAEAMIEAGMSVDLFCLSESPQDAPRETVRGVNVFRTPMRRQRGSKWAYFRQYSRFFLSSFWFLTRRSLRRKYDVVHVHNMPDFLVFAALVPKLRGARIILDLHDPMPELLITIYELKPEQWTVRLLRQLERWSIGFADLAVTPNIAFKRIFSERSSYPPGRIEIVMNSPQQELFDPDQFGPEEDGAPAAGEFRIMHHGSIVHRHGIDLLVEAVASLRPVIPAIRLDIYGSRTPFLATVMERAAGLAASDIVHYHGAKPQEEIAVAVRNCHLGVVPNRHSVFTENNFPTRLFEYLAMHRPVIAPSTEGIRDYFGDGQMLFFEPGNVADLAARILWVRDHAVETRRIVASGREVYRRHLWNQEKTHFVSLLSRLNAPN